MKTLIWYLELCISRYLPASTQCGTIIKWFFNSLSQTFLIFYGLSWTELNFTLSSDKRDKNLEVAFSAVFHRYVFNIKHFCQLADHRTTKLKNNLKQDFQILGREVVVQKEVIATSAQCWTLDVYLRVILERQNTTLTYQMLTSRVLLKYIKRLSIGSTWKGRYLYSLTFLETKLAIRVRFNVVLCRYTYQ